MYGVDRAFQRKIGFLRAYRLDMTQETFAGTFGLSLAQVRDHEQGRFRPSRNLRLLIAAIDADPEFMRKVALSVAEQDGTGHP